MTLTQVAFKRFLKGFAAGGLAQLALIASGGLTIHSLVDLQSVGFILLSGFIVGGILGLEKAVNYQP